MKFSALFAFAAIASVAALDTNESGLAQLGERAHQIKARHQQLSGDLEPRDWVSKSGKLTWYAGGQLDNPACGGATPTDNSMVVAVAKNAGYGKCGEKVHIHYGGKMVEATIVDYCAGCEWGHFDATKGVFKKLAPLSKGVLTGIHFKLFTNDD